MTEHHQASQSSVSVQNGYVYIEVKDETGSHYHIKTRDDAGHIVLWINGHKFKSVDKHVKYAKS